MKHEDIDHTGITGVGTAIADILDLATAETDDTLVLAPDGAGGVEFRAEAGGGGGGGGGGFEASDTIGETGTPSDISGGDILTITWTPAAGTYLIDCFVEVERLSGTHGRYYMKLDGTQIIPHTSAMDVNDGGGDGIADGVTYLVHFAFPVTLTNASHTILLYELNSAPMRYHKGVLTAQAL